MDSFKILALGGGGSKGFLHLGALEELEERLGPLDKHFVDGVYGCSVGSIIATLLAFGIPVAKIREIFMKNFSFSDLYKTFDMTKIDEILKGKGIFDHKLFEKKLIDSFNSIGIPIEKKVMSDALIPLRIQASNITKGISTIFRGNVPVLKAIMSSCAIPFVFRPVQINDSLYVDGGFLTNVLTTTIPLEEQERTLSLSIVHSDPRISPSKLKSMNPVEFLYKMYKTSCLYERCKHPYKNTVNLHFEKGSGFSVFTDSELIEMISFGRTLFRDFCTKNAY